MVKGNTRRVILVKSPDPRIFEEAIFIVREDARESGITPDRIMREAQQVASDYIRTHIKTGVMRPVPVPMYVLLGSALTGVVWALTAIIF